MTYIKYNNYMLYNRHNICIEFNLSMLFLLTNGCMLVLYDT